MTEDALQKRRNVLVDGSLRNANWYLRYFQDLRKRFPTLKIAIIHVRAEIERVLERARRRSVVTGRVVPEELIMESLSAVDRSMEVLVPQTDFYARIDNEDEGDPILEYCEMHDRRQQNIVDSGAVVVSSSTDTSSSISGSSHSVGSSSSSGSSDSNKSIRWCILQQEPISEEDAIPAVQPPQVTSATDHSPAAPPSPQSDAGSATNSTAGSIAGGSSSIVGVGRKRGRSRSRANSDLGGDIAPLKYLLRRYVHRVGSKDTVNTDSSAVAVVTTEEVAGDLIHDKVVPTEQTEVSEEDDIDWRDHFRQVWVMRCAIPAWWERRHAAKRALLQSSSSYSFRQQSETRSSSSHGNVLVSSSSVYRSESIFSTSHVNQEQ